MVPLKVCIWFKYKLHDFKPIGKKIEGRLFFVHIDIDLQIFIKKFQLLKNFLVLLLK
jgi:pimeloyl-CoA synthetase